MTPLLILACAAVLLIRPLQPLLGAAGLAAVILHFVGR